MNTNDSKITNAILIVCLVVIFIFPDITLKTSDESPLTQLKDFTFSGFFNFLLVFLCARALLKDIISVLKHIVTEAFKFVAVLLRGWPEQHYHFEKSNMDNK